MKAILLALGWSDQTVLDWYLLDFYRPVNVYSMLAKSQRNRDHFLVGYFPHLIGLLVFPFGHAHSTLHDSLLEL